MSCSFKTISLCIVILLFVCVHGQPVQWAVKGGGTQGDQGYAVKKDAAGNLYIAGAFSGNATFGSITVVSNGLRDAYLAKYDSLGNCLWVRNWGGAQTDVAVGLSVSQAGEVYVSGSYNGSFTFSSFSYNSNGNSDIYLIKFNSSGNVIWQKSYGGTGMESNPQLTADNTNSLYLTLSYENTILFGPNSITSAGSEDVGLVKISAAGTELWAVSAGGASFDQVGSICFDGNSSIGVVGTFNGNSTFGSFTLSGPTDGFLAKYDSTGNCSWAQRVGGVQDDKIYDVTADQLGSFIVAGYFRMTANFGTFSLTALNSFSDGFFAKYSPSGTCVWVRAVAGPGYDFCNGAEVSPTGRIAICGAFENSVSFGPFSATAVNFIDGMVMESDSSGVGEWLLKVGGNSTSSDAAYSITHLAGDSWICVGAFSGSGLFGTIPLVSTGSEDMFAVKIYGLGRPICYLSVSDSVLCHNETITGSYTSINAATGQDWIFYGGTPLKNINPSPVNVSYYNTIKGTYTASITASNGGGSSTSIKQIQVESNSWAMGFGDSLTDNIFDVKTDAQGNAYVCGIFTDDLVIGQDTLHDDSKSSGFVAKINSSGQLAWWKRIGDFNPLIAGIPDEQAKCLALDQNGNIYVSGTFTNVLDVDTFSTVAISANNLEIFVLKLNSSGILQWVKTYHGPGHDEPFSAEVDPAGNILFTGVFSAPYLQVGNFTLNNLSAVEFNAYYFKLDPNGNALWAKSIGDGINLAVLSRRIRTDSQSNVYITGILVDSARFGTSFIQAPGAMQEGFVAKFDPQGNFLWVKILSGTSNDFINGLAIGQNNNVFVSGYIQSPATFGSVPVQHNASTDVFLASLDPAGNILWTRTHGGPGSEFSEDLCLDIYNQIFVTGGYGGASASFPPFFFTNTTPLWRDGFVAKFDHNGYVSYAYRFSGPYYDVGNAISVSSSNIGYVACSVDGPNIFPNNLNPGTLFQDGCLYKMFDGPALSITAIPPPPFCTGNPIILSASTSPNYLWSTGATTQNINVSSSGTYTVQSTSIQGCSNSTSQIVQFNSWANASFSFNVAGNNVSFTNTSSNAQSYLWDFGDTTYSGLTNPSHTFQYPGLHTVCLWAINAAGCNDSLCLPVVVLSDNELPTLGQISLYPNPANHLMYIDCGGIETFPGTLSIYDLAGRKILFQQIVTKPSSKNIALDVSALAKGAYIINLAAGDQSFWARFVKD